MRYAIRPILAHQTLLFSSLLLSVVVLAGCVIPVPPVLSTMAPSPDPLAEDVADSSTDAPILSPTPTPEIESADEISAAAGEVQAIQIPLPEPFNDANFEYSGMAWYGDTLVLLPQFPDRFGNILPTLARDEIVAFLQGEQSEPPTVGTMPFDDGGLATMVTGFDGYEAIAFDGDQAFLTIETRPGNWMLGYVVAGGVQPDGTFVVDAMQRAPAPSQAALGNMTDETVVIDGERVLTIYEANGAQIVEQPTASTYLRSMEKLEPIAFPHIEYRITDATTVDEGRRFWAINYFFPGDEKIKPAADPLAEQYGEGTSHQNGAAVERLVELQIEEDGISLVDQPPIQLELSRFGLARNWEGIVRIQEDELDGFLLVTDKFPSTILAYVPRN